MMSFSFLVSMIFGSPQSCPRYWVMVKVGLEDTHTHTHTHMHCGHDRPKPQAPMWNESVNRPLFLHWAALWVNLLTQTLSYPVCQFSLLTHLVTCALPALWLPKVIHCAERVSWSCFCPVCVPTLLPGGFCLSALWPRSELSHVGLLPSEGGAAHLVLR